jgi:uncharacterized phage-associated protein
MPKDLCSPSDLAKWLINRPDRAAGDDMTHLKLQKLMYFAQAWHLANWNKPLFREDMQAWTHGPVVPSIWHQYKGNQWGALSPDGKPSKVPLPLVKFLDVIYDTYGRYSAKALERLTHDHDPWKITRGDRPLEAVCADPIDKIVIRDFYAKRINKKWPSHLAS